MGSFNQWFMPVAIAIVMFGIGLNLRFVDFKTIILRPRAVVTGLILQMIVLPLVAFLIIYFWNIEPVYKVGFILIAACPGGTMSNLVTYILKGHLALSVALTAFNSFLILITIPLIVNLAANTFLGKNPEISLGFMDTFGEVLTSVILPVLAGIITNEMLRKRVVQDLNRYFRYLVGAVMAVMVISVLLEGGEKGERWFENLDLLIPLLVLNISTTLIGYFGSRALGLHHRINYTVAIELGLQNSALAIFIATRVLDEPRMALVAVLYASFSFILTLGISFALKEFFRETRKNLRLNQ